MSIVYPVLFVPIHIGLPGGIVITGMQNRRVRKLGYNMEALRCYYAGQLHKNRKMTATSPGLTRSLLP